MSLFHSKAARKGAPTKIASDTIKEFYSFVLRKRKRKQRKQQMDVESENCTVMDQSSDSRNISSVHEGAMDCRSEPPSAAPASSSQVQGPILVNVDSHGNATQLPVIPPHMVPLPGGTQPTLVFFVGPPGMPAAGELPTAATAGASAAPFANTLFFAQPVTLNVVPQDTNLSGGVIEKAMELANFQTIPVQNDNQQPQSSTELVVSEGSFIPPNSSCTLQQGAAQDTLPTDHSFSTLPQVSQNIVITHSVATGENVPIDNVSQSVTVQTSQVIQNQGFADLRSFIEESRAEVTGTEIASAEEANNFEKSQRMVYKRKGIQIREVLTQTGGDPEVLILSERKLDCGEDSSEELADNADAQRTVKKPGLFC